MAKSMPRAGRPHRTPGSKPAPRAPGLTSGSMRDRGQVDAPCNPLGRVNGANALPKNGTGSPPPKQDGTGKLGLPNQGGTGS